ncbi:hypothetical protein D3C76_1796110 [compost metagenome]
MHSSSIKVNFIANSKRLLGCDVSKYMIRVIPDGLFLKERELLFQRRFPVNPKITLLADRLDIQFADIFIFTRCVSYNIG